MSDQQKSRITAVMERPLLGCGLDFGRQIGIIRLIEQGDEPRRILQGIADTIAEIGCVEDCAIFLPPEDPGKPLEIVARKGSGVIDNSRGNFDPKGQTALQTAGLGSYRTSEGAFTYFDIVCLGASIGYIVVFAPNGLTKEASDCIRQMTYHAGVIHERNRFSNTLQLFLDRLEVLNELNQLIAGNVGLGKIIKSIARESAFRFSADTTIAWLFNDARTELEARGGYGCAPDIIPKALNPYEGIVGEALRLGGNFSVMSLEGYTAHNLQFLQDIGIIGVDVCCLEVRGETLGALLLGYKRPLALTKDDLVRYEEFCQGAAVAISNARSQERLTQYSEKLEELIHQRTAELAVQTHRAEEANHAKSQFLANMSHELRTPLTAIVGYSSVLADGIFGELNEKQREALLAVARSSEHLKNLIDDVLNLARVESGKEHAEPARVVVRELLEQSYKLVAQNAKNKGITLIPYTLTSEVLDAALWVDPRHIQQILINLLSNSVKYTPKGGSVSIGAEIVVDKVRINVHDTGVGIPPHKMLKLFERFERGEDTYSKSQEGTGIGLNLTKRLIELNGGRIGVESAPGHGSTFWILAPLAAPEVTLTKPTKREVPETHIRLDGLTILVVDDNLDTCNVLSCLLQAVGAQVHTAQTVSEGAAYFDQHGADIVLTDLAIPGESGVELIKKIRAHASSLSTTPILVLSACAYETDKDAAMAAGASSFMAKPFKPADVIKQVRNLTLTTAATSGAYIVQR